MPVEMVKGWEADVDLRFFEPGGKTMHGAYRQALIPLPQKEDLEIVKTLKLPKHRTPAPQGPPAGDNWARFRQWIIAFDAAMGAPQDQ